MQPFRRGASLFWRVSDQATLDTSGKMDQIMNLNNRPHPLGTNAAPLVCGYLINQYPKVSHSFVRREILALERQGVTVHRYATRGWNESAVDLQDQLEQRKTRYLLQGGLLPLLVAGVTEALRAPTRWFRALKEAVAMSSHGDRGLPYHLVYFLEACLLAQWARAQGVQHLHAHFGTNSAETAVLAALMAPCPSSFTVHGPEEFDKPQALHLKRKVELSAFVAAISSYGRSQLFRWIPMEQWHKVKVVHCGLDASFCEGEMLPVPDVRRLVCIGRLCEQKGQLLLIEAAGILKQAGESFDLVLAGDGEMRPQIEVAIRAHGLESSVRITGWISGAQVREELLAARAMILPSFAEGLPVVIMEAMAMERPVLSTYVAGIPELVLAGKTGWLFPAGDVDCLGSTSDKLQAMGRSSRIRVMQRHDIDAEAGRIKAAVLAHSSRE